ncbi:hypothetical protein [Telmatospirillum sp. J64-1]|uniref:hypothetical protein n=1 Tax=Telmatospirillum sp. J64-1 TaxID=2502183 RepID=UPI00115D99E8|nr:hypothetical protein [Telmatospirillum sp. J64-1]
MIDARFDAFLTSLRPSPEDHARARAAAIVIAESLRRHFRPDAPLDLRDDLLVAGSVGKLTALAPAAQVDLLYLLPDAERGQSHPIETVEAVLRAAFPRRVALVAGESWVNTPAAQVRVLPAFIEEEGFLVALAGRWRHSNPVAEAAALRLTDRLHDGRATGLLLLAKAWARQCAVPVSSFELEILVREYLGADPAPKSWPDLFTAFLAWGRAHTPGGFDMPGGWEKLEIGNAWHGPAESAYWRAVLAGRHQASGDISEAIGEWRHLFGEDFPDAAPITLSPHRPPPPIRDSVS